MIIAKPAIAPMTMPAMAPADKAGFGGGITGETVGEAAIDELEPEDEVAVVEDEVAVIEEEVAVPT